MTASGAPAPFTLRDYALVADGERGAVVGPDGGIVWLCFPGWHDPAVFASLVGGGGFYSVSPTGRFVWGGYYEDATLIWRSRWVTQDAIVECREALAFPGDVDTAVLLRRVVAVEGDATVAVVLAPSADYGTDRARDFHRDETGTWSATAGDVYFRCSGFGDASVTGAGRDDARWEYEIHLQEGDERDLVLELGRVAFRDAPPSGGALWANTEAHWRAAVPQLEDIETRRDARHSYAVLRGLTSASGAMVAAATTSLPERAEAGRNYDYRYAWIRDQCLTGLAVAAAGPHPLLDDAVRFVSGRLLADGPSTSPAYTVAGGRIPDQCSLSLPGYPGGYDRVGNHVNEQFQLDAFGQALLLFAAAARYDRLDADGWRAVDVAVDTIQSRRHDADAGIWELSPRHWAHSALECVAGLRSVAAIDGIAGPGPREWTGLADTILAEVSASCTHPSGRWQRAPDDERVDASLLLAVVHGALASDDPRSQATHDAVDTDLARDGYLYRFRHDDRPLEQGEGAFLVCGFWMALSNLDRGDGEGAVAWFERNRAACGPPGLYAEEFDVGERQLRGNLPQAFVHAGMLECAARLSRR
jgi:alpha,alpha-trehalase